MTKVQISDETGVKNTYETVSSNMFIITPDKDGLETIFTSEKMKLNADWSINQTYLEIIRNLKKMYPEMLSHIVPERVMILIDDKFEKTDKTTKKSAWFIHLSRISSMGSLMQSMFNFDYVIKLRSFWLKQWSPAQVAAAILSQLLRIEDVSGQLIDASDERYLSKVAVTFGINYLEPNVDIPNVLETKVELEEFKKAPPAAQQMSMLDQEDDHLPFADMDDEEPDNVVDEQALAEARAAKAQ